MTRHVVIVGSGQSGCRAAEALRNQGFRGRVTLIGEESHLPYDRPPLSKSVLWDAEPTTPPLLVGPEFYQQQAIDLRLGLCVERIRRSEKILDLSNAESIPYDRLILATGLRTRKMKGFGEMDKHILHLRNLDDAYRLRPHLGPGKRILVVGGGLLGLEIGATCKKLGCHVTITELNKSLLYRTVDSVVGNQVEKLHHQNGVEIMTNAVPIKMTMQATGHELPNEVEVILSNGRVFTVDLVIGAIGSIVNSELAEACGLNVQDGVVVNEYGQTSDPDIFAIGDISRHYNPLLNRVVRVESWHNAENQAVAIAKYIAGSPEPYAQVPWFWSDQFNMNLQIVGYPSDWDRVIVRGDLAQPRFTVFYLQGDRLVAANTVNNGRDIRLARNWIAGKTPLEKTVLENEQLPLKDAAQ